MKKLIMTLAGLLCSIYNTSPCHAFFEESVQLGDANVSTVHYHMTRALAHCSGFNAEESEIIAVWSQLVDSQVLESPELGHVEQHFSMRTGPNDPFFHWARDIDLQSMRSWMAGEGPLVECLSWDCRQSREIETGLEPDSLEAFGTYLHMQADHWSHSQCMSRGIRQHTPTMEVCEVHEHTEEFGAEATASTLTGLKTVLQELVLRSVQEGTLARMIPDAMASSIEHFVTAAPYLLAEERVDIADELYRRCD